MIREYTGGRITRWQRVPWELDFLFLKHVRRLIIAIVHTLSPTHHKIYKRPSRGNPTITPPNPSIIIIIPPPADLRPPPRPPPPLPLPTLPNVPRIFLTLPPTPHAKIIPHTYHLPASAPRQPRHFPAVSSHQRRAVRVDRDGVIQPQR